MERRVARREERGDLGDTEQRISVEDEGDEELTSGEFRIVEGSSAGVRCFPVAATAPDTVGAVECLEAVYATVRAGLFFPDDLETPLDAIVGRLGPALLKKSDFRLKSPARTLLSDAEATFRAYQIDDGDLIWRKHIYLDIAHPSPSTTASSY